MFESRLPALLCLLLTLLNAPVVQAHLGPHKSKDCFIDIEDIRLRFNGYQFHGPHPDKHYCRYFPALGDIIIKIDALQELDNQDIALTWLEINDLAQLLAGGPLFISSKDSGWRNYANNLHNLRINVTRRGIYAVKIQLRDENGTIQQQQHYFVVGFTVMQILLSLAGLPLLLIVYFFIKHLRR